MANDVIFYTALAVELNAKLSGARIDKIYQPSQTELVLKLRGTSSETLFLSASPNAPRVYLTNKKRENPMDAPAFCMLLRKRIAGGTVTDVSVLNCDRILKIGIRAKTELRDDTKLYLLAELMGRYSNLILVKEDYTIIDAIKRIPIGGANRPILPNLRYELQPHAKPCLSDKEELSTICFDGDAKTAAAKLSGISKDTAAEILHRGKNSSFVSALFELYEDAIEGKTCPTVLYQNDTVTGMFPFDLKSIKGEKKTFASLSEAAEFYYENRTAEVAEDARIRELKKLARKLSAKLEKKTLEHKEKLQNDVEIAKNKHFGELIYSNLYNLRGGESILNCDDYENTCVVSVPLDPLLDAAKNAEAYFKKYRKLKRAKEIAAEQLFTLEQEKTYLASITESLETVTTAKEIAEAEEELKLLAGKRRTVQKGTSKKTASSPMKISVEGYTVYIGKNNRQNDEITFQLADRSDLWFHAKGFHGSHVVVKCGGKTPSETVLLRAAELAAYYSGAKNAPKAEVDYTEKRFVKRQGNVLGLVYYTDYKTLFVKPKP